MTEGEKKQDTRVYMLTSKATRKIRFVEARTPAQAYRHVAKDDYEMQTVNALDAMRACERSSEPVRLERAK